MSNTITGNIAFYLGKYNNLDFNIVKFEDWVLGLQTELKKPKTYANMNNSQKYHIVVRKTLSNLEKNPLYYSSKLNKPIFTGSIYANHF